MASEGWSATAEADIRKRALLVKIKTSRKKLFVLREESSNGPARLEYYDSEKKFKGGVSPKRCIVLKNCLSINAKTDSRHRHAIFLYTKDDCFGVAFDNQADQQDWLTTMIDLRSQIQEDNTLTKPLFEHIWPVNLKSKGLGSRANLPTGPYHLCLTNTDISLVRLTHHDDPPIILPLELWHRYLNVTGTENSQHMKLDCIRRCGHSHDFFFIEMGRSAQTGAGELWLHVEDTVISQNMHEAILTAMKNNTPLEIEPYRARTRSNVDKSHKKRPSLYGSTTVGIGSNIPKRSQSISVHKDQPSPGMQRISAISFPYSNSVSTGVSSSEVNYGRFDSNTSTNDEPDAGYPSSGSTRSMTPEDKIEEESEYFAMNPQSSIFDLSSRHISSAGDMSEYLVFKPGASSNVTESSHSEYMAMPGASSAVLRTKPSLSETDSHTRNVSVRSSARGTSSIQLASSPASSSASEYMEMNAQAQQSSKSQVEMRKSVESITASAGRRSRGGSDGVGAKVLREEGYMEMEATGSRHVPGTVFDSAARGSSGSVSSMMSVTSGTISSAVSSRTSFAVDRETGFQSLSRHPELAKDMYMDMSPVMTQCNTISKRLDIVHSYLRDGDIGASSTSEDGFPKRAYSVGSKPGAGVVNTDKPLAGGSYVDMSGTAVSDVRRSIKETEKSCSAPHLNDDAALPAAAAAVAEGGDLFMELDFNRKGVDHHVGLAKTFRDRASSGGSKDLGGRCSRTLSFSAKDALSRITFFRPASGTGSMSTEVSDRRPRTSTICQESLRPRTSSFGAHIDDSRPRSSSGGNARLRDVFGPESLLGAHRLGLKSKTLSSTVQQVSTESSVDSLNAGADYTDMFPRGSSVTSRGLSSGRSVPDSDEYMAMHPGESLVGSVSDYVPMHLGEQSITTSVAATSDYMAMKPVGSVTHNFRTGDMSSGVSNVSECLSKVSGEAVTTSSNYMPMGFTGASRMEPQKSHSDAPVIPVTNAGGSSWKFSSSSTTDHQVLTRVEPETILRVPFELEAGLSLLHYATPDSTTESVTSLSATVASPVTATDQNPSPYIMMGGSGDVSYAALDLGRGSHSVTEVASVARTSAPITLVGRRSSDTGRCSHVYAEIDFGSDKHRSPTTSCVDNK